MTVGPEHFAAIAERHFIRLKEITMTATAEPSPIGANFDTHDPEPAARPSLPSAADHYAAACGHLADAETPGTPIAESHRLLELATVRVRLGHLAVAIWPEPGAGESFVLGEMSSMAQELARQRPVVVAARDWFASIDVTGSGTEAELAEAVRAWEAGE